ncbi:MAG: beta-galactosidase, partial [Chloroflexi bacterium]|nr:beta-galactosidase [Chloroflexota bacterium]
MTMQPLRLRQIHLDYHTAAAIPDVGAEWDAQAFAETLQRAHVNSVTCFARCHHGYVYYAPTRYEKHPALSVNLLGEQIEACHRAGIRAPIYITVGWDELSARRHPEWLQVSPEGLLGNRGILTARWKDLCLNADPYLEYVWGQTREVLDLFGSEVDGLWFDIIHQGECVCRFCLEDMRRQGLNPERSEDRQRLAQQTLDAFRRRFSDAVRAIRPEATLFYNAGHMEAAFRSTQDAFTHFELESLPSTGQWGYDHFPITVRYARTWGKPYLGMTGKFHTSWGDFGSYKNLPALEFECFQMIANGAACSIGDQLHPRGRLGQAVYDLIGRVYASVEQKEPWCLGAAPQAEIAVFNVESVGAHDGRVDTSHSGALRMLLGAHHQFDFVDGQADWTRYRVLVLPDKVPLDETLTAKVRGYLANGGKVIASHRAGLTPAGDAFALPEFGISYIGEAPYSPDYLIALPELGADLADAEYVMYDRALEVRPLQGTQTLARTMGPYFNRTWDRFCSHRQAPPDPAKELAYPAITCNAAGNVIYLAHPIFYGYRRQAVLW